MLAEVLSCGNGVYPTIDGTLHKERVAYDYYFRAGQGTQDAVNESAVFSFWLSRCTRARCIADT